jgi:hypothetical protein
MNPMKPTIGIATAAVAIVCTLLFLYGREWAFAALSASALVTAGLASF